MRKIELLIFLCVASSFLHGQGLPAFPGAEGFGAGCTGGRGGKVIIVTNLNDSGPGSLRAAIDTRGPRIIVFSVGGYIDLKSPLEIKHGDVTIGGQSAPGSGICIRDQPVRIRADNVVIRFLRVRLGDRSAVEDDAINSIGNRCVMIDHCSFSWGTDECASFYDNRDFTLQWSIISEGLNASVHKKGEHGYGGIWGGLGATFHHNLISNHKSRTPRFCGARYHGDSTAERVDFRNNFIFNWKENGVYGGERGNHNVVANYFLPGPATERDSRDILLKPFDPPGAFFLSGNVMHGNQRITKDNGLGIAGHAGQIGEPLQVAMVTTHPAGSLRDMMRFCGASRMPDDVDKRLVAEAVSGTAAGGKLRNGIIDTPGESGGWPELRKADALPDSDHDGMPDAWERKRGLDPLNPEDASLTSSEEGYSHIENYLNSLVVDTFPRQ